MKHVIGRVAAGVLIAVLWLTPGLVRPGAAMGEVIVAASASTVVTPVAGGLEYSYTITNVSDIGTGPGIVTWAMPFFDDADTSLIGGESSIFTPEGWTFLFTPLTPGTSDDLWGYVAADDPKNDTYGAPGTAFENPPYALVFLPDFLAPVPTPPILPGESLGGFGYISTFTGTDAPFIAGFDNLELTIGDPVVPHTPSFPSAVPEPASAVILLSGLIACSCAGLRRTRRTPWCMVD